MRYYKHISGDYIDYVGTGVGGIEISEIEYKEILDAIPSDIPPDGYRYKLNTDLTPELYKIPEAAEDDEIRDSEALEIITGVHLVTRTQAETFRAAIDKVAQSADDAVALQALELYPAWAAGQAYTAGYKVQYGGKLWRVVQTHTSQAGWEPENAAALWTEICETHDGTIDDPIPYSGNMALESGKYYIQNNVIYRCTRDTINPVYNALADLVGIYVEVEHE